MLSTGTTCPREKTTPSTKGAAFGTGVVGLATSGPRALAETPGVGLAKAAGEWWRPGPDGRDIFNHPGLDVSLANAIGQRLWAQGQWRRVHEYFGAWPVKGRRTRAGAMLLRWLPDNG